MEEVCSKRVVIIWIIEKKKRDSAVEKKVKANANRRTTLDLIKVEKCGDVLLTYCQ